MARKEDLTALVAEVRAVTVAQKEIEAKISGDLWERQWRLNQKRDLYARLMESMSEVEVNVEIVSKFLKRQPTKFLANEVDELTERVTQVVREFYRARAVAGIYLFQDAIAALGDLTEELKPEGEVEYSTVCQTLARAQAGLVAAAKADLGLEIASPQSA